MTEELEEYQPKQDSDVYNFITAFKIIIYLGLGITVFSLITNIIKFW